MFSNSRRTFLRWTLAGGLAGLAGCASRTTKRRASIANARVIVVGGGYGGATAARYLKLLEPSLHVTLVEQNTYYLSCPSSNLVLTSLLRATELRHSYRSLAGTRGIELVRAEAVGVDSRRRMLKLADGSELPYDRLIVSPGIDFRWGAIEGYDEEASLLAPHAWKAGAQTSALRRQLRAMPNGGVVLITVPANPYRCPPGPYERASLIAHFLSAYKPRSKVILLDEKTKFSKQSLFMEGWQELYPGMVEWVSMEKEGKIERVDAKDRVVHTEFGEHRADVLNVIPPQKAGGLAAAMGLADSAGWCPVDSMGFESTLVPGIHVIGDACIADPMPKSAFAANAQAKVCAAAVIELLHGDPAPAPALINHCYSFLNPGLAISITGVYAYDKSRKGLVSVMGAETPPHGDRREEAERARSWYKAIAQDTFG